MLLEFCFVAASDLSVRARSLYSESRLLDILETGVGILDNDHVLCH